VYVDIDRGDRIQVYGHRGSSFRETATRPMA